MLEGGKELGKKTGALGAVLLLRCLLSLKIMNSTCDMIELRPEKLTGLASSLGSSGAASVVAGVSVAAGASVAGAGASV